jgi:hypothetical protein
MSHSRNLVSRLLKEDPQEPAGQSLATMLSGGDRDIRNVVIQTHYGSEELEITEYWIQEGTLKIAVQERTAPTSTPKDAEPPRASDPS